VRIIPIAWAEEPKLEQRVLVKWPSGKPMRVESYVTGRNGKAVQHGPAIEYLEDGQKRQEVNYANGKRNGQITEWDAVSHEVIRQGAFKDGNETGLWTWWHVGGEKAAECTYKDGRIMGKKIYWLWGKVSAEKVYNEAGDLVQTTKWYDGETMRERGTYKDGKKDGTWTYWSKDGTIKAEGVWKKGLPWSGTCGVPVAGDAGSWGGLQTFHKFKDGKKLVGNAN
jgi:antitoxin component YwqK of YwqJK toxin-antitoxin module